MGFLLGLIFLIANLLTNSNYGFTWDLPHHFNAGLRHLGLPPVDSGFGTQPYGPIADTLPVISWLYLFKNFNILPKDEAYHIPIILYGSLGIVIIYYFTKKTFGLLPAFFSAVFLALYPRYIGHIHNNMKDPFSAVTIALAIYSFLWIINPGKKSPFSYLLSLIIPPLVVGIAFNTKVNAILIFPIIILWLLISYRDKIKISFPKIWNSKIGPISFALLLAYLLLSVIFSLLIWWPFWQYPLFQLKDMVRHFSEGTTGFRLLYYGKIYFANINVPWHYGIGYLAAVTPAPVLILAIIGFIKAIFDTFTLKNRYSGLVLTWFLIPTLKYLDPKIGVIDGIRHFMEAVFPLMIFAGIGTQIIVKFCGKTKNFCWSILSRRQLPWKNLELIRQRIKTTKIFRSTSAKLIFQTTLLFLIIFYLLSQIISVHPYETAYFGEWLGGLKGANKKFDLEFWGNSLKEGSRFLNNYAPKNSVVWVPMAEQVAKEYLRPDIKVTQYPVVNTQFVMFFNRPTFFDYRQNQVFFDYLQEEKPIFVINRQQTPLLWIFKYVNKQ